jgi:hypothetical protein
MSHTQIPHRHTSHTHIPHRHTSHTPQAHTHKHPPHRKTHTTHTHSKNPGLLFSPILTGQCFLLLLLVDFLIILLFLFSHKNDNSSCNPLIPEGDKKIREIDKSESLVRTLRKYAIYFSMWLEEDLFNG